jgi:hypothetical protein
MGADHDFDDDHAWRDAGFDPEQAASFRDWRIDLVAARQWHDAGVDDGLAATRWSILGASPGDVPGLVRDGLDLETAFEWRGAGFDLDEAHRNVLGGVGIDEARAARDVTRATRRPGHIAVTTQIVSAGPMPMFGGPPSSFFGKAQAAGVDMQLLHGYAARHWMDDDALAWAVAGVDVVEAYQWCDLGLDPAEVRSVVVGGASFFDVLREWWPTGIPFAELADWIGAGLDPDEAVAQRAKGITVDHAAALRALRRGDRPEPSAGSRPGREARWGPPREADPPHDEAAARDAIDAAFAAMTTREGDALPAVEGGHNLGPSLTEAQSRAPGHGQPSSPDAATITVDRLRFVSTEEAVVVYTLALVGGFTLAGRAGRAVLIDGEWKVARDTFCELMSMAGVVCPPP